VINFHPNLLDLQRRDGPETDVGLLEGEPAVDPGPQQAVVPLRLVQLDLLLDAVLAVLLQEAAVAALPET
jgi:hypothetical protein